MNRLRPAIYLAVFGLIGATGLLGCRSRSEFVFDHAPPVGPPWTRPIETPCLDHPPAPPAVNVSEPLAVGREGEPEDWYLTLEQAIQITLANSEVIREIGGRVIAAPRSIPAQGVSSIYDVALQEMDPQTGVEAALSAFDAQVATSLFFARDEQTPNNPFISGGAANSFAVNTGNFNLELSKQSAAGTRFAMRNVTDYSRLPPRLPNLFPSSYNTAMEAEFRHPLLRGSGIDFNRIAGPRAVPGSYNGVILARIRTDIALADFEAAVRNLVRDVEEAYWQLYFAYRGLDAQTAAYQAALESWRTVQELFEAGAQQINAGDEGLARANLYLAKASVQNALAGSPAGTGIVGVYSAERELRYLMGIPPNDGRLIRPADEPSVAQRIFDWQDSLQLALFRRVELRRQRWTVKQRENELLASRNFLLSQLDLVGLYRWRGFGDDLLGSRDIENGSAFRDLFTGDLQGWQLGLEYSTPLGRRREHAAVRFAELNLAREKAVLRNHELRIANDLSGQFAELDRAYLVAQANFNRAIAEQQRLTVAEERYNEGVEILNFVVDAQRDRATADSDYHQSLVDYNLAVADFHFVRGTYLDYVGVHLSEGPWVEDAYRSYRDEFRRFKPRMNYCITVPSVSSGPYPQRTLGGELVEQPDAEELIPEDAEVIDLAPNGLPAEPPQPIIERLPE